ncbi:taste receptor type 2 member 41-like [Spea bombifrons]|uniref:taste receptor type 2 member 41-like n=1 Tax=Spea bombifrons TaxID=233779 RepID=UPI00234BAB03|nr:taste receptor type 2 member 41-like [Spea bombifrons]
MISFQELKYVSEDNKAGLGVFGVVVILGLMVNAFIVAVNLLDWIKQKQVKPSEKTMVMIATSRLCFHCVSALDIYHTIHIEQSPIMDAGDYIDFSMLFFNYSSLWYVSLLAAVFCLKIANYSNALFVGVKTIILRRFSLFIVAAAVISFLSVALFMWADDLHVVSKNHPYAHQLNGTRNWGEAYTLAGIFILGYLGPFSIYSFSFYLFVTSLCLHMNQMRSNSNGFSTRRQDGYYAAIKAVTVCFAIYCLSIGSNIFHFFYYSRIDILKVNTWINTWPILHSIYLIYRDNKLRQRLQAMLRCLIPRRGIRPLGSELDTIA